jgi:hypothetical protein
MDRILRSAEDYQSTAYITPSRLSSYWHQVDEVCLLGASSVLCIGPGNSFVPRWLRDLGLSVWTTDYIASPVADVRGDVRHLPFRTHAVDVALCPQVLEHVPWPDVPGAVTELSRLARVGIVVTLPRSRRRLAAQFNLPMLGRRRIAVDLPRSERRGIVSPAEHHWEIDQPGQSLASVEEILQSTGLRLQRSYRVWELDYHHVFVLRAP